MTDIASRFHASRPQPTARRPISINGNTLLGLLILYPFARFVAGELSLVILFVVFIILAFIAARAASWRLVRWFVPLTLLTACGWLASLLHGPPGGANYFLFLTVYFIAIATCSNVYFNYPGRGASRIYFMFCVLVVLFILFPALKELSSEKYALAVSEMTTGEDSIVDDVNFLIQDRFQAYFIHANEFGIFAAALFYLLVSNASSPRSRASRTFDRCVAALLAVFVIISGSVTGYFLLAVAAAMRLFPKDVIFVVVNFIFLALFATQTFFAQQTADWLDAGSLYWRYAVASEIIGQTPLISFAPNNISMIGNWPHSVFLDFTFLFGILGPLLLFCVVSAFSLLAVPRITGIGVLVFFCCAALQPAGAMATCFLLLILAIFRQPESRLMSADSPFPPPRLEIAMPVRR